MIPLRQSTASQEIPLGPFLDSTNGDSEENSLTIANTDIKLWKHGATTLANKNSGGATNISNGVYYCVLDATDSNTLGGMVVFVHVAGALAVRVECEVMTGNRYDALVLGTDKLEVDAVQLSNSAQSLLDLKDFADDGYNPVTHKVQGVVLADTTTTNSDMRGTNSAALATDANPEMLLSTTVAFVDSQTEFRLTSSVGWADSYKDQIVVLYDVSNSNTPSVRICTGYSVALQQITLDSVPDFTVVNGDLVKIFAANTSAVPTSVEIRTEIDSNSTMLSDIDGIVSHTDYGNAKLVRSTTPANTLDVATTGEAGLDFANIKDATGAHTLTNITVPTTTAVTNEVTADAVKISGDATAANNLELQYDTTGLTGNTFPATQAQIGTAGAGLTDLGGMSTAMKGEVNDEVADVYKVDTTTAPTQGAPTSTPTSEEMQKYIYFKLRNKGLTTATEDSMYADNGTTKIMKAVLSDDGTTFTKDKYVSGA